MTRSPEREASNVMPHSLRPHSRPIVLSLIVVGLLAALLFYHPPRGGLWTRVFFDTLHVPLFGVIATSIYFLHGRETTWQRRAVIAFLAACMLGALSEAAQILTSRDASLRDLLADGLGAASFLAAAIAVSAPRPFSFAKRVMAVGGGLLLLGWAMAPLATVSAAYVERHMQFPALVNPAARFGHIFTRRQNITYRIVQQTDAEPSYAHVTFGTGPWPGVAYHDLWPDWSPYSTLVVDVEVEGDTMLEINLRVHDKDHEKLKVLSDRFTRAFQLSPGRHSLRIALADVEDAPATRSLDLTAVTELIIFAQQKEAARSFRLYGIRLE